MRQALPDGTQAARHGCRKDASRQVTVYKQTDRGHAREDPAYNLHFSVQSAMALEDHFQVQLLEPPSGLVHASYTTGHVDMLAIPMHAALPGFKLGFNTRSGQLPQTQRALRVIV